MNIRRFTGAAVAVSCIAGTLTFVAPSAFADDSVLVQTGQNLPPLVATTTYDAGAEFADDIRAYQTSGRWSKDRAQVVAKARTFLAEWLRTRCGTGCKPAVVFDIDDTLVSWYGVNSAIDFGYDPAVNAQAKQDCTTPKIKATASLFADAKRRGVDIFLITGRTEDERAVTEACLATLGLSGYRELILRGPNQQTETAKLFKSGARRDIEARGWDIALAIGDQVSDSSGGYTDGRFVLPNPMYFIP